MLGEEEIKEKWNCREIKKKKLRKREWIIREKASIKT